MLGDDPLAEGNQRADGCTEEVPDELRERAVRLVRESGRPIARIAEDLVVHREALRLWVRQAKPTAGNATTCSPAASARN